MQSNDRDGRKKRAGLETPTLNNPLKFSNKLFYTFSGYDYFKDGFFPRWIQIIENNNRAYPNKVLAGCATIGNPIIELLDC